jgi:glutamyl-tRNA reductase
MIYCISVSFKKTPLPIRQKFSFSKEEQPLFLQELINERKITGGVIVSTCNRSEIYVTGTKEAIEAVEDALSVKKEIERETIRIYCLYYKGKKAVRHLFRVVCGLDSMVLGEDEILRQVKEAYQSGIEADCVNGTLHIIFQGAFHCAKLSKSETRLSNIPVSIGTLTANKVDEYLKHEFSVRQQLFLQQQEKGLPETNPVSAEGTVLVIGATGKIGSIVAKDLMAKGIRVLGTQRKHHLGEEIFPRYREQITFIGFDERYQYLPQVDAVVSATASPHYTLTKKEYLRCAGKRKQLLIDLAVPYDIDKEIAALSDVELLDIDYFQTLSAENGNIRLDEAQKVESILQECVEEVMKNLYVRQFTESVAMQEQEIWFSKMIYYLKGVLESDQLAEVLDKVRQEQLD